MSYQHISLTSPLDGTVICSSTIDEESRVGSLLWSSVCLSDFFPESTRGLGFRERLCGNSPSFRGCFSESAALNFSLTSSTRFVLSPPLQIMTAAPIPHKKLPGMRIPVDQGGRSNLFKPHIVPQRKIWKIEFPSFKKQIQSAMLIGKALWVSVPWALYQV